MPLVSVRTRPRSNKLFFKALWGFKSTDTSLNVGEDSSITPISLEPCFLWWNVSLWFVSPSQLTGLDCLPPRSNKLWSKAGVSVLLPFAIECTARVKLASLSNVATNSGSLDCKVFWVASSGGPSAEIALAMSLLIDYLLLGMTCFLYYLAGPVYGLVDLCCSLP